MFSQPLNVDQRRAELAAGEAVYIWGELLPQARCDPWTANSLSRCARRGFDILWSLFRPEAALPSIESSYISDMQGESMEDIQKPRRSAKYLLRFTPEEKAELEQKVRRAAAEANRSLSLADALRAGAHSYLDDLLQEPGGESERPDQHEKRAA